MADLLAKVDEAGPGATVDFVSAIAYPLPAIVLAELLGVPVENHQQLRDWSEAIGRGLDTFVLTAKEFAERDEARAQLDDFFAELVAKRRVEPTDDLVSALVAVEQEGDRLTEVELVTTCRMILSAGYITTVNWITNGMLALLENPDQLAWLRENRDQLAGAADELLRYDAPIQMVSRTALVDAEVNGMQVPEGTPLLLIIAAGNRDPEVYPEPTKLDLSRPAGRNLAFGLGIHFCVGAPVARLATEVALEALLDREITLAGDPVRAKTFIVRGLAELPVVMSR